MKLSRQDFKDIQRQLDVHGAVFYGAYISKIFTLKKDFNSDELDEFAHYLKLSSYKPMEPEDDLI